MSTKTRLTLEQFSQLPDYDEKTGARYELDRGELVIMPPMPAEHEMIKMRIAGLLWRYLEASRTPGQVLVESGFVLDPQSWRVPDVAYFGAAKAAQVHPEKPMEFAPDLAVEVNSPSNSPRMMSRKVAHFRASGTHTVWVVYPGFKEVHIIDATGERWLTEADTLEAPELLPGFSAAVSELFK